MIVVVVDAEQGTLNRLECADKRVKLTHRYDHGGPVEFPRNVVEEMRMDPPALLSVEPQPDPPLPPGKTAKKFGRRPSDCVSESTAA